MTVEFVKPFYNVLEGNSTEICLWKIGENVIDVSVTVFSCEDLIGIDTAPAEGTYLIQTLLCVSSCSISFVLFSA